jgi:hypothetical protein
MARRRPKRASGAPDRRMRRPRRAVARAWPSWKRRERRR